ncbi:hypothetical protein DFH07DRAFT_766359 [Mycena maculata]|uniref:Uncharacterized protein n=1 Tax=Mycena maculata TaxID=230809 RepID=A0AAD7K3T8_9AGAR|nr:hypothetical protein DFH07DRAFT_766359 [Mycena maculata]
MGKQGKSKGVQDVQDDIQDMVQSLDPGALVQIQTAKQMFSPFPSPQKKATRSPAKRKKVDENADDAAYKNDLDSDTSVEIVDPPKKKMNLAVSPDPDDDDDSAEMSFYLYVETPSPPVLHVCKGPSKPIPPKSTELGPFIFNSSIDYDDFLQIISQGCHVKSANLVLSSLRWKFDRPANSKPKGVGNKDGFKVMIKSLKDRHKDYVFSVLMAPPSAVKQELPWLKDEDSDRGEPLNFDYSLEELTAPQGSVLSIREQLAGIDQASQKEMNELLEAYPLNNNPLFPDKCIFHNETGFFDLTDLRLCERNGNN